MPIHHRVAQMCNVAHPLPLSWQMLVDYALFDGKTEKCHADDQVSF